MIENYRAYTGRFYRLMAWLIYPLVALGYCYYLQSGFFHRSLGIAYLGVESILSPMVCMVEIVLDGFAFRGISAKEGGVSGLLQASGRGERFLQQVLMVDLLRRISVVILLFLANFVMAVVLENKSDLSVSWTIGHMLLTLMVCLLSIFISRFSASMLINLSTAYIMIPLGTVYLEMSGFPIANGGFILLYIMACMVFGGLLIYMPMKRLKECYYDKG